MTADGAPAEVFDGSRASLEEMLGWLGGADSGALSHAELEARLDRKGRELLRQMFQEHLELRARREERGEVIDIEGVARPCVEAGHHRSFRRSLAT